jgi:hypothetical protein
VLLQQAAGDSAECRLDRMVTELSLGSPYSETVGLALTPLANVKYHLLAIITSETPQETRRSRVMSSQFMSSQFMSSSRV